MREIQQGMKMKITHNSSTQKISIVKLKFFCFVNVIIYKFGKVHQIRDLLKEQIVFAV